MLKRRNREKKYQKIFLKLSQQSLEKNNKNTTHSNDQYIISPLIYTDLM